MIPNGDRWHGSLNPSLTLMVDSFMPHIDNIRFLLYNGVTLESIHNYRHLGYELLRVLLPSRGNFVDYIFIKPII